MRRFSGIMGKEFTERKMRMDKLRSKKGYICDMDGVIYHGNLLLDGAYSFYRLFDRVDPAYPFFDGAVLRVRLP